MKIHFDLFKDKDSESGYLWTSIIGKHKPITPGSYCTGYIIIDRQPPIEKVFYKISQLLRSRWNDLQMEVVKCGAASLAMILAYYGKRIPLEILRQECCVTRDGSNAENILKAAENFGCVAKGWYFDAEASRLDKNFTRYNSGNCNFHGLFKLVASVDFDCLAKKIDACRIVKILLAHYTLAADVFFSKDTTPTLPHVSNTMKQMPQ